MTEHKEAGEREQSEPSDIVFASEEVVELAREQLRAYTESEDIHKAEHANLQVGFYGPRRYVGLFKTIILTRAIEHAETQGYQEPLALLDVLAECREETGFALEGAEDIDYVANPRVGIDDKDRLDELPDFSAIDEVEGEDPVQAFHESWYTIQKFAQGIRQDIYGGSVYVEQQNTWESIQEDRGPTKNVGDVALRGSQSTQED